MRPEKQLMIEEIKKQIHGSSFLFLTQFTGMNVAQMDELRRRLDAASAQCRVVKNSLLSRAARDCGYAVDPQLTGQTAIVFARSGRSRTADVVSVAKALRGYMKETEKPRYKQGFLEGKPLSEEELKALAELPGREVLLATLLGLLQRPAQQLLYVLNAHPAEFLGLLKAYEEKKQKETAGTS